LTSIPAQQNSATRGDGLRPVNLGTDLAQLADLMELVFASSMDQGGRAAVNEMRTLSHLGMGLLAGMNDLTVGINMGYVWIDQGKLVGNVSVYPARKSKQKAWIIANVGVHPDYRRRGIARDLLRASMDMIYLRGGQRAVLQVDADNDGARRLYADLGFVQERSWTTWRRSSTVRPPPMTEYSVHIAHRRPGEWQAEFDLAQRLRPDSRGGLGWQRPLDSQVVRYSLGQRLNDWFNLRSVERLLIRSDDANQILAALWIERAFLSSSIQLTLLVDPAYQGIYDEVLINSVARRFANRGQSLVIEHPSDETVTSDLLRSYSFRQQREVIHMRWDVP
jgi:ribosomal protein S18 acetylase RimI-like enzyme